MLKGFTLTMWVGFGGFLGTVMRYWITYGMQKSLGVTFPYGTLLVNLVGCYLIGLLGTMAAERVFINPSLRQFLFIGILGGFTTFSSFTNGLTFRYAPSMIILKVLVDSIFAASEAASAR